jgi:hypothetical protein
MINDALLRTAGPRLDDQRCAAPHGGTPDRPANRIDVAHRFVTAPNSLRITRNEPRAEPYNETRHRARVRIAAPSAHLMAQTPPRACPLARPGLLAGHTMRAPPYARRDAGGEEDVQGALG